jgi:predicted TIM-barrel fold metal-dependent hydrolase
MPLPRKVVDCHTHFMDPVNNRFQSFLRGLGAQSYLPEQYEEDTQTLEVSQAVVSVCVSECVCE